MLEIASLSGIKIETLGLPILGAGFQKISLDLILIPVLNECIQFLQNNSQIKEIHIITIDQSAAFQFAKVLDQSYSFMHSSTTFFKEDKPVQDSLVFIIYSSKDKKVADALVQRLENNGLKAWYAPRDIHTNDYATAIVNAITNCTHFVVILSENSLKSQHVLNEIDIGFSGLKNNIHFNPIKIDDSAMDPAFIYYLSRQHWIQASNPPLEDRLDEFVSKLVEER